MLKSERFRQEANAALAVARAVAEKAQAENRGMTAAEEAEYKTHFENAQNLNTQRLSALDDEEVLAKARALSDAVGLGPDDGPYTGSFGGVPPARTGGRKAGSWGKAVIDAHKDAFGNLKVLMPAGSVPVTVPLQTDPVRIGEPVLALRQLISAEAAPGGRFSFMRQTVRTNLAAAVAPGALKPTSTYTLARVDDRCRTVAHLSEPINRQDISDAPLLQDFVETELRLGLDVALDAQILVGDGTGENLTGLMNTSGIQAQAWSADILTTCRKALTKLQSQNLTPTGWVFNPADWETVELRANTAGSFIYAEAGQPVPVDQAARRLWGVPVVVTNTMPAGTALLADFAAATLWVAEDTTLSWSENVNDDFSKNQMRWRCEGRFGLSAARALAFVSVDLTP